MDVTRELYARFDRLVPEARHLVFCLAHPRLTPLMSAVARIWKKINGSNLCSPRLGFCQARPSANARLSCLGSLYAGTMALAMQAPCAPVKSNLRVSLIARSCGRLSVRSRGEDLYACNLQIGRSCSSSFSGRALLPSTRLTLKRKAVYVAPTAAAATPTKAVTESSERFRLNNLSPQKGARRQETRKGRGYGAGQVGVHTLFSLQG